LVAALTALCQFLSSSLGWGCLGICVQNCRGRGGMDEDDDEEEEDDMMNLMI